MTKYDVVYSRHGMLIEPHFCREMGCYGTSPHHGFSFEEARQRVVEELMQRLDDGITFIQSCTEEEYFNGVQTITV